MDKRILIGAGVLAALGLAIFLLPGEEGTAEASATAEVRDGPDPEHAAKLGVVAGGLAAAKGQSGEDAQDEWNPGGEHEPDADDSQRWYWLQQDLDRMIDEARPKARKRLSAADFRAGYLKSSAEYMELSDEERESFEAAANRAIESIEDARATMQAAQEETPYDEDDPDSIETWKDAQATFKDQQAEAAAEFAESLPVRSRTTLLRENAQRWVVRLDFGIKHAGRAASR